MVAKKYLVKKYPKYEHLEFLWLSNIRIMSHSGRHFQMCDEYQIIPKRSDSFKFYLFSNRDLTMVALQIRPKFSYINSRHK